MPVQAAIKFTQGFTTDVPGRSVIGALAAAVTLTNGDNSNVANWLWEIIDVPAASTVPVGVLTGGNVPSVSFTPDVRGSYLFRLTVSDLNGNQAQDLRAFAVLETSGRLIPPFLGNADTHNFGGNVRGWAKYLEEHLQSIGGGGFTAGGDLSGTPVSQTVEKVKGTAIATAGGALPTGYVLKTTGVASADWQPVGGRTFTFPGDADYGVLAGDDIIEFTVPLTASRTATLPGAPSTGEEHTFKVNSLGGFTLVIDGNGNNVDQPGGATSATVAIGTDYSSYTYVYNGTKWSLV